MRIPGSSSCVGVVELVVDASGFVDLVMDGSRETFGDRTASFTPEYPGSVDDCWAAKGVRDMVTELLSALQAHSVRQGIPEVLELTMDKYPVPRSLPRPSARAANGKVRAVCTTAHRSRSGRATSMNSVASTAPSRTSRRAGSTSSSAVAFHSATASTSVARSSSMVRQ